MNRMPRFFAAFALLVLVAACEKAGPEVVPSSPMVTSVPATAVPDRTLTPPPLPTHTGKDGDTDVMSIVVSQGNAPTIDGVFSPGEWDSALAIELANGQLLLMYDGGYLYAGIRSNHLGLGSVCVAWNDEISILHSSAALGTATYVKAGEGWQKTRDFSWTNREVSNSQQALEERSEHLERENWLASNGLMGNSDEMEYQIGMINGELRLGVTYLMSPDYETSDYWPDTLGSGCRDFEPLRDDPPETVLFEPETWMTIIAPHPVSSGRVGGLSEIESATLSSLELVDDYPLYTMIYQGAYNQGQASAQAGEALVVNSSHSWACSLFAALGDEENMLYGRNFDWQYSPALLLFTDPPDGYASVSMVDIEYLVGIEKAGILIDLPLAERAALLEAPFWPFDGMNEHGLAIGMAAVPPGDVPPDPDKETVGSLMVMRRVLDQARDVDEAVAILQGYNIEWGGGPDLHYLVADQTGRSMLVEFYQGETILIPNSTAEPWHQATNFLRASAGESAAGKGQRYDQMSELLREVNGRLTSSSAMTLLSQVAQKNTQWSIIYGLSDGDLTVTMGQVYGNQHSFVLSEIVH